MKEYRYFKCRFCKDSECILNTYEDGKVKCHYGTCLSIFRWVVRIIILVVGAFLQIGIIVGPIYGLQHPKEVNNSNVVSGLVALSFALCVGELIMLLLKMYWALQDKGGSIWGER